MSYNQRSGNPQGGKQKKEIFNQWQATGVLRALKESEPLKFTPWQNGGVLNGLLVVMEPIGVDENGQPKVRKFSMKVSIKTNKNITAQQLQSLVSGTKVRVVSRLVYESYTDRNQQQVTKICADVYVLEVLEVPMQNYQQPYYQPQVPTPQPPQYQPQYPPQAPPQYQPQPPQYQPQYSPQAQSQPQAQPQYPPQYPPQVPPYYQQPAYGQGQSPMPPPPSIRDVDDLPPA